MVYYAVADDVCAAAVRFAATYDGVSLWCRHLDPEGDAVDFAAFHARLVREFANRFGTEPALPGRP